MSLTLDSDMEPTLASDEYLSTFTASQRTICGSTSDSYFALAAVNSWCGRRTSSLGFECSILGDKRLVTSKKRNLATTPMQPQFRKKFSKSPSTSSKLSSSSIQGFRVQPQDNDVRIFGLMG